MLKNETIREKKNKHSEIERLTISNEVLLSELYGRCKRRYLEATILDNDYLIEILRVCTIVKHPHLGRYTMITDCAFMEIDNKPVLAVELRDTRSDYEGVTVVVAEVRLEGNPLSLGFIVNRVEDFYYMMERGIYK